MTIDHKYNLFPDSNQNKFKLKNWILNHSNKITKLISDTNKQIPQFHFIFQLFHNLLKLEIVSLRDDDDEG